MLPSPKSQAYPRVSEAVSKAEALKVKALPSSPFGIVEVVTTGATLLISAVVLIESLRPSSSATVTVMV